MNLNVLRAWIFLKENLSCWVYSELWGDDFVCLNG